VGVSELLVLDATPSADPDDPGGSGDLLFDWSCEVADAETEALGSVCVSTMTADAVQSLAVGVDNLGLFHFRHALLSFVCSFVRSFVYSFVRSFVCSFIRSFVRSFVFRSFSFARLFVCLFVRSFVLPRRTSE
jgi:hypothetical protein